MNVNPPGLIAGAAAFLGIWFGHVAVRRIEFISPTLRLPTVVFAGLGLLFEVGSVFAGQRIPAAVLGILGVTLLWDAFELTRQQKRVIKGHAPANPRNPRHARLMADHPSMTTLDRLKRDPLGRPIPGDEPTKLITEH